MMEEYRGSVFSNKSVRDPPVMGSWAEATIVLKPAVTPKKQRPFQMHGNGWRHGRKLTKGEQNHNKIDSGRMLGKTGFSYRSIFDYQWRGKTKAKNT